MCPSCLAILYAGLPRFPGRCSFIVWRSLSQVKELESDGKTLGGLDQVRNRVFGADLEETERSLGASSFAERCLDRERYHSVPSLATFVILISQPLYSPLFSFHPPATANAKLTEAEAERATMARELEEAQAEVEAAREQADGLLNEINELLVINRELNDDLAKAGGEARSLTSTPVRTAAAARAGQPAPRSNTLLPKNMAAKIEAALLADLEDQLENSRAEAARLRDQLEAAGAARAAMRPLNANTGGETGGVNDQDAEGKRRAGAAIDFFAGLCGGKEAVKAELENDAAVVAE